MERIDLPEGWEWRELERVAPIDLDTVKPQNNPDELFNYIALENLESETGRLLSFKQTPGRLIKSNKFKFDNRHVLLGKLRPYLIKVFIPEFEGICSTDILPLLPVPNALLREYLGYYLRSENFKSYSTLLMEGTKMPRLRTGDIEAFTIPVPPLVEQRRIVVRIEELVKKVEEAKKLLHEAQEEITIFIPALLSKAFRGEL
ncbi:hypothetical protein CEE37_06755 [candidate division LCP-89 bacterium B3_LCP]|uniref:Type I restriction modification DNA specificity domain-containing protein n=1 Tax=candidate division LCP-89 bacterium B3_LCP TaxID=2012998 RepID=A0A532V118_UNCL8|nr:MAG: hypothetical protein CEE37_06755 [candidate division LCP-89 bacterium B3_LCP]